MTDWSVVHDHGTVGALHRRSSERLAGLGPDDGRRLVVVHHPVGPALVLGSTQAEALVDADACRRQGVEVARRRSGGGAVLVDPGDMSWVDVLLPAGDVLWSADVGRAAWWLGEAWAGALGALGGPAPEAAVWRGPLLHRPWSALVCFAGLGPGEVTIDGAKVVGISQRRARWGALFQSAALVRWRPQATVGLLALSDAERARATQELVGVATGAGRGGADALAGALLAGLP